MRRVKTILTNKIVVFCVLQCCFIIANHPFSFAVPPLRPRITHAASVSPRRPSDAPPSPLAGSRRALRASSNSTLTRLWSTRDWNVPFVVRKLNLCHCLRIEWSRKMQLLRKDSPVMYVFSGIHHKSVTVSCDPTFVDKNIFKNIVPVYE